MDWILIIAVGLNAASSVLAWAAKLFWSKEYSEAKNQTIAAKDAQIEVLNAQVENLKELTPMRIREYFLSVKQQLEEYNDHLKSQLRQVKEQLDVAKREAEKLPNDVLQKAVRVVETELQKVDNELNTFYSSVTISGPDGTLLSLAEGPRSERSQKWLESYWADQEAKKKARGE